LASLDAQSCPDQGGVVARMVTENLSVGGLYCTSDADFPEMTRLAVRLMLPIKRSKNGDNQPLDLEAVVVRREVLPSRIRTLRSRERTQLPAGRYRKRLESPNATCVHSGRVLAVSEPESGRGVQRQSVAAPTA
jgi:hypothetical protein